MAAVVSYATCGVITVNLCPLRTVESIEVGLADMDPIGRRVEVELLEEEVSLRRDCLVFVVNNDPVSCDLFLSFSNFFRASSGSPSHLLFTLGTCSGSFCFETLVRPTAVALPVFTAAAFFCSAANCSNAFVEGSFSVKNPSTPPFFFSFSCCCCECFPCEDPLFRAAVSMLLGLER